MDIKKLLVIFTILIFLVISPCFAYDNTDNTTEVPISSNYGDVYFNQSSLSDGDGSIENPYNKITMDRINNYATLHLADGEYNVSGFKSISSLSIVGESNDKTIIRHDGLLFTVLSELSINNITLSGVTIKNQGLINSTNVIFSDSSGSSSDIYNNVFGGVFDNYRDGYVTPTLYLDNCTFRNNHAEYGGAIYLINSNAFIYNCLFEKNIAYNYGGAIACDGSSKLTIKNTLFKFDSSSNDAGGALYLKNSSINIEDSNFTNCNSTFGGAICDLNSDLSLYNVVCSLNNALYDGGAIFKMYGDLSVTDSKFSFNTANNGAAIFADNSSSLIVQSSRFSSNNANNCGGAIYSLLNNNSIDKSNIYTRNKAKSYPNVFETDLVNMFIGNNNYSMFKYNNSHESDLPARYSSLDEGFVTPVKDQQASGNCWAFTAIATLESCILKASNITYDLSEENMKNLMELYSDYGWKMDTNNGGYDNMALGYLASWLGPVLEENDPFDDYSTLSPVLGSIMHVQNVIFLGRDNFTDNGKIKEAILKYGAVGTGLYYSRSYLFQDAYYYSGTENVNHAVTIVGWDDDYPYYNFGNPAPANGAWIVKNSWEDNWADKGYFYVSYYDTRFAMVGNSFSSYTFILNDTLRYDKNYQYDIIGFTKFIGTSNDEVWYENVFNSTDDEVLAAFSTYFNAKYNWTAYVYVNDELSLKQNGTALAGYYTFDFNDYIYLNKGDSFKIVVKLEKNFASFPVSEKLYSNKVFYKKGDSFFSYDGKEWYDLYDYSDSQVACLKAFTISPSLSLKINISEEHHVGDCFDITAFVLDNPINGSVIFNIDGNSFVVNMNDGIANLPITFNKSGNYESSAYFVGEGIFSDKINFTIQIKDKLLNTTIYSDNITSEVNKSVIVSAVIYDENNELVNNGNLTLTVGNNTYLCPVENGTVIFEISFDMPGNYTIVASFNGINYFPSYKIINVEINMSVLPVPSILYVSPSGDDNNLGTRDSPLATLSHAINITETGNIVLLEGIHKVNGLNVDKTLNITGEGNVTIDASSTNRIMYVYSTGDVIFSNIKMINGYSSESGALLGNAGKLTLINTTLSDSNSNNNGGALYNDGTLTIIGSIFKSNTANLGGAIYSGGNSKTELNVKIVNTTFAENIALGNANNKGGGAIYAQASSGVFILENVTFENNIAGKYGGGALYALQLDNIIISDSKFINNSAEVNEYYGGGAIAIIGGNYQREGTTSITNTLFENNNANMCGGAIYLKGTNLDISNSVLVNSADANGIVIYSAPTVNSVNSKITANDNWWGSNNNPKNLITKVSTVTLNRWTILTIENDTAIAQGNKVNIVVSLTNYTTGSVNGSLSKPITIKRNVSVQTSFEEFDGVLENGICNLSYSVPAGLKLISATVDGQTVILYVVESQASINLADVTGKKGSKVYITAQIITPDSQIVNDGYINFYIDSKLIGHSDVLNNNANLVYLIKEDEGIYNLTAEYVSESGAFNASNATAMLNVSGLNNIVREDNFYEFFDENGIILDDILFDELIFEDEFNNVPQIITIDHYIKITGDNAVLNNIVFNIMVEDVELNNLTFNANQDFMSNYGSIFLVTSNDVTIINNKINYTAPGTDSYVIYADEVNGLKVINNEITFANEFHAQNIFTNAIYLYGSMDILMENNTMDITIPSVNIDYDFNNVFSEGVVLDDCENAIISNNNIQVKYNSVIGNFDTLRAVNVNGGGNIVLANNTITAEGHKYVYTIVLDGNNFNLYNNTIVASSDVNYANGININGPASGVVDSNSVSAIAPYVSYPIYSSGYTGEVNVLYENNTVYGNANDVYGIYVSGTGENLTSNEVTATGNFTIGIASSSEYTVMSNNTIYSLGSNIGQALNLDVIPCLTSGITSISNCIVDGNMIETTGNYSVNIQNGQVINNYLIANNTSGDKSVKSNDFILIENNTPLTANLTVNDISLNVGDEITFNVTLTDVDNNPLANYAVNLNVNGGEYQAMTNINGIATFEIDSLPAGIYEMDFIVDNKNIVELIEKTALLNITLNEINVNVTASNICEGEDLIINVTVSNNIKEDLIIRINNSTYSIKTSGSIVISDLSLGEYSITIYYPGDEIYGPYCFEGNVTVYPKVIPKENLTISASANPITVGEDAVIFVTGFEDATGNVSVSAGDGIYTALIVDGVATIIVPGLVESTIATVYYAGDDSYNSAETSVNITVGPAKINTTISAVYNNGALTVTLINGATGKVIVGANVVISVSGKNYTAKTNSNGKAKVTVSDLAAGTYTAVVSYKGNSKYAASSDSLSIVVKADTSISAVYDKGELTVTLINEVTGKGIVGANVVVSINGENYTAKTNSNGKAKVIVTGLAPSTYTAVVSYKGNSKYAASSATVNVAVKTTTSVSASYDSETGNLVATLTNTLENKAIVNANVAVTINGVTTTLKTNSKGQVKVSSDDSNIEAVVSYAGNSKYTASSATLNVFENKITTSISSVYDDENGEVVTTLTNTATGKGIVNANVVVTINGVKTTLKTNSKGQVKVSTADLDPKTYTVVTSYAGNTKYTATSETFDIFKC